VGRVALARAAWRYSFVLIEFRRLRLPPTRRDVFEIEPIVDKRAVAADP
jgi:hypothetical protein